MTATLEAPEDQFTIDISVFEGKVEDFLVAGGGEGPLLAVQRAYGELEPRREKAAARSHLTEAIRKVIEAGEIVKAKLLYQVQDSLSVVSKSKKSPSLTNDPTNDHVFRVLSIQLGYSLAAVARNIPAGVDDSWIGKVASTPELERSAQQYRDWIEAGRSGPEPQVSEVAKAGARISLGRAPKGQGRRPKDEMASA